MAPPRRHRILGLMALFGGFGSKAITAALTLTMADLDNLSNEATKGQVMSVSADQARAVTLPTDITKDDQGTFFLLHNGSAGAYNLTVNTSLATISQNEMGVFYVNSSGAWALFTIISCTT